MALLDFGGWWRKSAPAADGATLLADLLTRLLRSKSGVVVTKDTAIRVATVFACCRVLMDGVAQVPFKVMRKTKSSVSSQPNRQDADEHPLYDLLYRKPNGWQTSFEFRETMMLHALLGRHGAFAYKNVIDIGTGGPRVAELILLQPERVTVKQREDYSLVYTVQGKDGGSIPLRQEQVWHLRGPSWNGVEAMDVLAIAREAIGLAISAEESQARLHANGVRPSGVYSVEGALTVRQQEDLTAWLKRQAAAENIGNPLVLDRAAKWIPQSISDAESQHGETRRAQIEELCRFFRVMPIMVGYSDKTATFASAEAMFLAHVVHTLMPWYERIQQSADVNLLSTQDRRDGYYTKLQEAGLMRGDMRATAEYLARLTLAGIMERNVARAKLDLNPLEGLDEPLTPTNMTTDPTGAPAPGVQT